MGYVSRLLKNTAVLMASNLATKGLSALFIIYLAIYLEDYGFGKYNFALSFAMVFIIFSDLGLDALTIKNVAKEPTLAGDYLETVGILRFGLSIAMIAISITVALLMGIEGYLVLVIFVAGLTYLFDKMSGLFYAMFRASERMEYEAGTQIAWKAIQIGLGFGAIYFGFSLLGIMLVLLVSSVIKTIIGFTLLMKIGICPSGARLSQRGVIKDTMPFAAYEIGNALYMNISVILLFLLQSPYETGWFSAGLRIIMFMLLIPSAFDAAIYPLFSKLYGTSTRDMNFAYGKSIKFSLVVAIPAAVALAILSTEVAGIFGSDYENTGKALIILAALLPLYTLNMLMKTALWSGDAQKQIAWNIWISVLAIAITSYLFIIEHAYIGAAMAIVISEAVFLGLNIHSCRRKSFPMGRYLAKPVVAGIGMVIVALTIHFLGNGDIGRPHIAILSGSAYLLIIILTGFITSSDRELIASALSRHRP